MDTEWKVHSGTSCILVVRQLQRVQSLLILKIIKKIDLIKNQSPKTAVEPILETPFISRMPQTVGSIGCTRKSDGFWSLKTSLPDTRRFHTDSHGVHCCLEFNWHGNVSICVNTFFQFALKRYFISITVRFSGASCIHDIDIASSATCYKQHNSITVACPRH
jgi:hypothetical protein